MVPLLGLVRVQRLPSLSPAPRSLPPRRLISAATVRLMPWPTRIAPVPSVRPMSMRLKVSATLFSSVAVKLRVPGTLLPKPISLAGSLEEIVSSPWPRILDEFRAMVLPIRVMLPVPPSILELDPRVRSCCACRVTLLPLLVMLPLKLIDPPNRVVGAFKLVVPLTVVKPVSKLPSTTSVKALESLEKLTVKSMPGVIGATVTVPVPSTTVVPNRMVSASNVTLFPVELPTVFAPKN